MKKRNGILARIGIVALALTLVTSSMTSGTLARYTSQGYGKVTALVARWAPSAQLSGTEIVNRTSTEAVIVDLRNTISTDSTINYITNTTMIAPGVKGAFNISVDAGDSDVHVKYFVHVYANKSRQLPTTFRFTVGSGEGKPAVVVEQGTFNNYAGGGDTPPEEEALYSDTLIPGGNGATATLPVSWEWPYQSGAGDAAVNSNDALDTAVGKASNGTTPYEYCVVVVMKQVDPYTGLTSAA